MNAYQLWRMTANPIDPNKRARNRKLWRVASKDYSLRIKQRNRLSKARSMKETVIGQNNQKMSHRRMHPSESTDTILLTDKRYKSAKIRKKRAPPGGSFTFKRSKLDKAGVLGTQSPSSVTRHALKTKWTVASTVRPRSADMFNRPEPKFIRNESKYLKGASVLIDSKSVDADIPYNRKRRRQASPRRNQGRSIKWLMANQGEKENKKASFRNGTTKRQFNNRPNESHQWFCPPKEEQRKPNFETRYHLFGF